MVLAVTRNVGIHCAPLGNVIPGHSLSFTVKVSLVRLRVNAFGPHTVRAVTHLDVSRAQCEHAAEVLVQLLVP